MSKVFSVYEIRSRAQKKGLLVNNNPKLPIDKKPKNWDADDLFNAMESPLYKYDKQLQNMAKEYIKHRSTHRYGKKTRNR